MAVFGAELQAMSSVQKYLFDGELLTVAEIHLRVPALSEHTIRNHLRAGRTGKAAMLNYCGKANMKAGGRKGKLLSPSFIYGKTKYAHRGSDTQTA